MEKKVAGKDGTKYICGPEFCSSCVLIYHDADIESFPVHSFQSLAIMRLHSIFLGVQLYRPPKPFQSLRVTALSSLAIASPYTPGSYYSFKNKEKSLLEQKGPRQSGKQTTIALLLILIMPIRKNAGQSQ